jgi:hypothetical protein
MILAFSNTTSPLATFSVQSPCELATSNKPFCEGLVFLGGLVLGGLQTNFVLVILLCDTKSTMAGPSTWSRVLSVFSVMIMLQIVLVVSTNVCGSTNGNKSCTGPTGDQLCCSVSGVCDHVFCSEPSLCQGSDTGGYNSPGPILCYSNSKSKGTTPPAQATFDVPPKPFPRATAHGMHESLPNKGVSTLGARVQADGSSGSSHP